MMQPLRIVFAGTPAFSVPCLEAIRSSAHDLLAVYTQPDRPAGRGRHLQISAVKAWANDHAITVHQPLNFKDPREAELLMALQPDIMIVIAYGLILPRRILDIPRYGCINVHASLLPRWRGASPIQHAIWHGDSTTGITIMQMDAGMDTGAMITSSHYTMTGSETTEVLHGKLSQLAISPLLSTLDALRAGTITSQPQDHDSATYAPKITKEDARIDWEQPAKHIDQQIRAFNPWPIAYTQTPETIVRIHQAHVVTPSCTAKPGTIIAIEKSGITISAGEQAIQVERLQFPGGNVLAVRDWLNADRKQLALHMIL
jgi:methionyl-tRNA formyltransferase